MLLSTYKHTIAGLTISLAKKRFEITFENGMPTAQIVLEDENGSIIICDIGRRYEYPSATPLAMIDGAGRKLFPAFDEEGVLQ